MLPAAERLPEARRYVAQGGYFVVHAPRQTGKSTTLRALARELTAEGEYAALHFSCEAGQAAGDDLRAAQQEVLRALRRRASIDLPQGALQPPPPPADEDGPGALATALTDWARTCPRPLVLFFDEIDALLGDSLIAVLRQLREGFPDRPDAFPWSVALCGLRDVRDYKAASGGDTFDDDFQYVRDLGLVAADDPVRVSNPIYREVVVRVLASAAERQVTAEPRSFVLPDGRLDLRRLLEEFAAFWVRHGEVLAAGMPYHEVAPQLVLMAFLHRIVNAGGHVEREYGVGRGRIDLLVRWRVQGAEAGQGPTQWQQEALELKVWRSGRSDPLDEGLRQLEAYLERLGLQTGVLVVFDRRDEAAPLPERTSFDEAQTPEHGWPVTVLRA